MIDLHHRPTGKIQPLNIFSWDEKKKAIVYVFCLNSKWSDIIAFLYQEKWIGCFPSTNNSLLFSSESLDWDTEISIFQQPQSWTLASDISQQNRINLQLKSYQWIFPLKEFLTSLINLFFFSLTIILVKNKLIFFRKNIFLSWKEIHWSKVYLVMNVS